MSNNSLKPTHLLLVISSHTSSQLVLSQALNTVSYKCIIHSFLSSCKTDHAVSRPPSQVIIQHPAPITSLAPLLPLSNFTLADRNSFSTQSFSCCLLISPLRPTSSMSREKYWIYQATSLRQVSLT